MVDQLPSPPNDALPDVEWVRVEACPDWNAYPTGYLHRKSCQLCQGEGYVTIGDPIPAGRLVDSEAIDYRVMQTTIRDLTGWILAEEELKQAVAAALGASNDKLEATDD